MVDRDLAREHDAEPRTHAGGRVTERDVTPPAPGVLDTDEVGQGVSVGDGTLGGPAIGGSVNPPAAGVVDGPAEVGDLVAPAGTTDHDGSSLEGQAES